MTGGGVPGPRAGCLGGCLCLRNPSHGLALMQDQGSCDRHHGLTVLCGELSLGRHFRSASGGPLEYFASHGFLCRKSPF